MLSILLLIDGSISLIAHVAQAAEWSVEFYAQYVAPVDVGGVLRSSVLLSLQTYRAVSTTLLGFIEPALRDVVVIPWQLNELSFLCAFGA